METLATIDHINECTSDRALVTDSPVLQVNVIVFIFVICVFSVFLLNVNRGEWSFRGRSSTRSRNSQVENWHVNCPHSSLIFLSARHARLSIYAVVRKNEWGSQGPRHANVTTIQADKGTEWSKQICPLVVLKILVECMALILYRLPQSLVQWC